ncbi:MAG TPA: cytochrome c3 family protein, partial [Candidatus Sulfotelmatobacter sp.]|nr:cytochrome c3 family protein [Candidatus Sulfotelmatobacter sp.]
SNSTYTTYTSTTAQNTDNPKPPLGNESGFCLSCHDGTVAAGDTVLFGKVAMNGSMYPQDNFGTQLQGSHPFSLVLPLKDSIDLVASIYQNAKTADPKVPMIMGNVECTSCHNPHAQATDKISLNFLVRDSSNGQLCIACHDPNRTASNQTNPLAGWGASIHYTAQNKVSTQAHVGPYPTVAANSCSSCHAMHNAGSQNRLLRASNEQDCISCHSGGSNVSPAAPDVFTEFKKKSHPFPAGSNTHDAAEKTLLNTNRHATCADCHDSHASQQVTTFSPPPIIRVSQTGIAGISGSDGTTVLTPAVNQYENCLRCHGTSIGKQSNPIYGYLPARAAADPLNVLVSFGATAKSTHPVMRPKDSSGAPQPSLLPNMLDLQGGTTHGRPMGTQILCTDCHNSDDNREFGGAGANGPHGSQYWHILERDYESSQAPGGPGTPITINLNPLPDLTIHGPYGMCAKCHNLNVVMQAISWSGHQNHVYNDGVSCSVCHNAHGVGSTSSNPTGDRMIDFDVSVVGSNSGLAISYNRAANTCTLMCHNVAHNPDGTVKSQTAPSKSIQRAVPK